MAELAGVFGCEESPREWRSDFGVEELGEAGVVGDAVEVGVEAGLEAVLAFRRMASVRCSMQVWVSPVMLASRARP